MDRNLAQVSLIYPVQVVPYVGTWIEMSHLTKVTSCDLCRSLRGNVDRNGQNRLHSQDCSGRSLRGNVDRNFSPPLSPPFSFCRSLRGNVDRNLIQDIEAERALIVVPYVGTWIEMKFVREMAQKGMSFPTWERG